MGGLAMGHDVPHRTLFRTRPAAPPDASFFEPHELPKRRGRPATVITKAEERESHRRWSQAALHQRMRGSFTLGEGLGLGGVGVTLGVALSQDGQSGAASYSAGGARAASTTARGGPGVAAAGPAPAYGAEAGAEPPGAAATLTDAVAAARPAPRGTTIIPTTTLPIAPLSWLEARPAGEVPGFALFSVLAGLGQVPARAVAEAPPPGPAEITAPGPQHAPARAAAPRDAGHVDLPPMAPASSTAVQAATVEPAAVHIAPPPPVEVAKLAAVPVWTAPVWTAPAWTASAWLLAAETMPRPMADRAVAPHAPEAPAVVATVVEEVAHRWTAPARAAQPEQAGVVTPVVATVTDATTGVRDLMLDRAAQATLVDRVSEASRGEPVKLALATDAAPGLGHGALAEVVKAAPAKAAEEASPAIAATVKGLEGAAAAILPGDAGANGAHGLGAALASAVKDAVGTTTASAEAGHGVPVPSLPAIGTAVADAVKGATPPAEAGHGVPAPSLPPIGTVAADAVKDTIGTILPPAGTGHDGPLASVEAGPGGLVPGLPAVVSGAPDATGVTGELSGHGAALPAAEVGLGSALGHGITGLSGLLVATPHPSAGQAMGTEGAAIGLPVPNIGLGHEAPGLAMALVFDHAGSISDPAKAGASGPELGNPSPVTGPASGDAHAIGGQVLATWINAVPAGLDLMVGPQPAATAAEINAKAPAAEPVSAATPAAERAKHAAPGAPATDMTPVEAVPHGPAATTEPAPAAPAQLEAAPHGSVPAVLPTLTSLVAPALATADHPPQADAPPTAGAPAPHAADTPGTEAISLVDALTHPAADPPTPHLPPASDGVVTPPTEAAPLTLFPPPQDDRTTTLAALHPDLFTIPEPEFSVAHPTSHDVGGMVDPHPPTPILSDFVFA
jgi:hypothetical protein